MFLVILHCFAENLDIPCIVAETKEKAQEWINKEMEGRVYSGGVHQIKPIEVYR